MKGEGSKSNALAVQLDATGKVKYDVIARQGHSKDKVFYMCTIIMSPWLICKSCILSSTPNTQVFVDLVNKN